MGSICSNSKNVSMDDTTSLMVSKEHGGKRHISTNLANQANRENPYNNLVNSPYEDSGMFRLSRDAHAMSKKLGPYNPNAVEIPPSDTGSSQRQVQERSEGDQVHNYPDYTTFKVKPISKGSTYQGQVRVNPSTTGASEEVPHGFGRLTTVDGSEYIGFFENGKKQGNGRLIDSGGDCYSGEWVNDLAEGKGTYYFLDGSLYYGGFVQGKFSGRGTEIWADGSRYIGDFEESMKQGSGTFKWPDGSFYTGTFVKGEIEGHGAYTWSDGRFYEGGWKCNKMDGKGVFRWGDGKIYEGEYIDDKKHGYGEFQWGDGRVYKGNWKNGKQHGEGMFISDNGEARRGIWQDGVKIKWVGEDGSAYEDDNDVRANINV